MAVDQRAHLAVRGAVLAGVLPQVEDQSCADCGRGAQAYHHHNGYEQPHWLDVVALCDRCHMGRHPRPRRPEGQRRFPPMPRKKRPAHGERLPRLNVEVYPDEEALVRRVRAAAAERGETLHDLVMRALRVEVGVEADDGR